jgi:hypothetical protein
MGQLFQQTDENRMCVWSSGYASFLVGHKFDFWHLPVAVRCQIGDFPSTFFALLDTGAEWSVLGGELAILLVDQLGLPTESFSMSTRLGRISGALHRIPIRLLAELNCGYDLTIESSIFVSQEWTGPLVLGYRGFLERLRFALDPGIVHGEQRLYFGVVE